MTSARTRDGPSCRSTGVSPSAAGESGRSRCPDCDNPIGSDDFHAGECAACGCPLERPSSVDWATDLLIGGRKFELPDGPTASRYIRYAVTGVIALFVIAHVPFLAPRWIVSEPPRVPVPCTDPCPVPLEAGVLQVDHSTVLAAHLSPLADNTAYLSLRSSDSLDGLKLTLRSGSHPRVTLARRDDSAFWSVSGARGSGAISLDVAGTVYVPLTLDPPLDRSVTLTVGSEPERSAAIDVQRAEGALGSLQPSGIWLLVALSVVGTWGFVRCGPKLLWALGLSALSLWLSTITLTVGRTRMLNTVGSYASEPNYPGLLAVVAVTVALLITAGVPLALIGGADRSKGLANLRDRVGSMLSSPARRLGAKVTAGLLAVVVAWLCLDLVGYAIELVLPGWTM